MKPTHELRDSDAAAHAGHGHFNESDPHGAGGTQSHHHVVSLTTLRLVLGALLMFTFITVAAAQFESWFQGYINFEFPRWVNVAIAMSIATIKAIMVLLFFMQLKHDNPINGVIFVLCIVGVGLFLGFTTLDLFTRDRVYSYKGHAIVEGGTSFTLVRKLDGVDADGKQKTESIPPNTPIVKYVRDKKINEVGQPEYDRLYAEAHAEHSGGHEHAGPPLSTASKSILRNGRTDALESVAAHNPEHAPTHEPAHAGADKPAEKAGEKPAESKPAEPPAGHAVPEHK